VKKIVTSGTASIGLKSVTLDIKEIRQFIYFSKLDTLERGLLLDSFVLMRHHHAEDTIPGLGNKKRYLRERETETRTICAPSQTIQ
jgi:hypothetical protein